MYAAYPRSEFLSSFKKTVMARFMRATHGNKRDASVGGPDKPGHDGFFIEKSEQVSESAQPTFALPATILAISASSSASESGIRLGPSVHTSAQAMRLCGNIFATAAR